MLTRLPSIWLPKVLKRVRAKAESSYLSLFICSVDISSASDSVTQAQVLTKLLECGVNAFVVASLEYSFDNFFIRIKLYGETLSRPVKIIGGLKQGSLLSPILFSLLTWSVTKGINGSI